LFGKNLKLPVLQFNKEQLIFENRLVADALPVLSKQKSTKLLLYRKKEIEIEGTFHQNDEDKVKFVFGKISNDNFNEISNLLARLYTAHLEAMALQKKKKSAKVIGVSAHQFKILVLSNDKDYLDELEKSFENRNTRFFAAADHETLFELIPKQTWDVLLIDGQTPGLDLWKLTQEAQENFTARRAQVPHMILVSDDLSEDAVVYAQYCGLEHIYDRSKFLMDAVNEIGMISGHLEWVKFSKDQKCVVIIDDDKNVTFTLQHSLCKEDFRPIIIRSGMDGVRAAKQYKPVCILIEIALRSGDGKDALKLLHKLPYTKDIPVIILSVSSEINDVQFAKQNGVRIYLNKPLNTDEIINNIKILTSMES
jgi:DNA-binding response OmpR family regulator